jgi:hypothetical protein
MITVSDYDERGVTFIKDGQEISLTRGEIRFLKNINFPAVKEEKDGS